MATAVKTARTVVASATLTATSTTTGAWNLTTAFGGVLTMRITNGGTGPTIPCTATVNVSTDNSTWRKFAAFTAGVTNSAVYDFAIEVPAGTMYAQTSFNGNTAQSVTIEATGHELTSIG